MYAFRVVVLASLLLGQWCEKGENEVSRFVDEMIKPDEGLIMLINGFVWKSYSTGTSDYVSRVNWRINLDTVNGFISVEEVVPKIRSIIESDSFNELSEEYQRSLKIFIDTVNGKIKD